MALKIRIILNLATEVPATALEHSAHQNAAEGGCVNISFCG